VDLSDFRAAYARLIVAELRRGVAMRAEGGGLGLPTVERHDAESAAWLREELHRVRESGEGRG